ncbi:uncharacterized protein LOC143213335 isoform X2 [Lasioglossum baleicum]|uniref:uncharacterized protein LOC143213335 isoform X2 n=1 Tax=Lasioglossum baleicum TaxID=434251 RepID=UPI003FCCDF79
MNMFITLHRGHLMQKRNLARVWPTRVSVESGAVVCAGSVLKGEDGPESFKRHGVILEVSVLQIHSWMLQLRKSAVEATEMVCTALGENAVSCRTCRK